jgi:hypothetical protein
MTWVFLTTAERNKISHKSGPYIADSYEPHEAAVRQKNPRENWIGLTEDKRKALVNAMPKGHWYVSDLFAAIEAQLKEKNFD